LASYAFFRNRIDELVADASLTAEHVFADFRRAQIARKRDAKRKKRGDPGKAPTARPEPRVPSVAIERDKNG
jgi:hypothetical protein